MLPSRSPTTGNARAGLTNKDAAGFIVSDSGQTRVWKNGDFVATTSASGVRFPGQVRIAIQSAPQESDEDGKADKDTEAAVGAGDEQE